MRQTKKDRVRAKEMAQAYVDRGGESFGVPYAWHIGGGKVECPLCQKALLDRNYSKHFLGQHMPEKDA